MAPAASRINASVVATTGQVQRDGGRAATGVTVPVVTVAAVPPTAPPAPGFAPAVPAAGGGGGGTISGEKENSRPRGGGTPRPVGSRANEPQSVSTG